MWSVGDDSIHDIRVYLFLAIDAMKSAHELRLLCFLEVAFKVVADITNSLNRGSSFILNFDFEGFFDGHNHLNNIQRVGVKIISKRSSPGDISFFNIELVSDDALKGIELLICHSGGNRSQTAGEGGAWGKRGCGSNCGEESNDLHVDNFKEVNLMGMF